MIFWSAELFVRAARISAIGLLAMIAPSVPASSPAAAQDGHAVVNCFDEALGTVKQTLAHDCEGRTIGAEEAAEVRRQRQEYIQKVLSKAPHSDVEGKRQVRSGSGFFVADDGSVLTSHHLVDGCSEVSVAPSFGEFAMATAVVPFAEADLALLHTAVDPPGIAAFAEGTGAAVMGSGFVSGYPEQGMVTITPMLTPVEILRRESQTPRGPAILVSGDIRRGNSGGPLLDTGGSVVGVVLAKTDSTSMYQATGQVVPEIGFILPGDLVQQFLDAQGVGYQRSQRRPLQPAERMLEDVRGYMVQVGCWQ
jgi:S1-C subfamily serine protease